MKYYLKLNSVREGEYPACSPRCSHHRTVSQEQTTILDISLLTVTSQCGVNVFKVPGSLAMPRARPVTWWINHQTVMDTRLQRSRAICFRAICFPRGNMSSQCLFHQDGTVLHGFRTLACLASLQKTTKQIQYFHVASDACGT